MLLYNLITRIYFLIIYLSSPFNPKAKLWINGRKNLLNIINKSLQKDEKRIWIHCASLGEFEQGRPIIERLKTEFPHHKIVLTFFSPSGYEIRKNYKFADYVFYLPADTSKNAKALISLINPDFVIFIKYEFWMHYINELWDKQIPLYLVSANFRKEQLFFKWYGSFYRNILNKISYFFVQNDESKALLSTIGIKDVMSSGDTRFDRVYDIALSNKEIPFIANFCKDNMIFIAGSIYTKDAELIASLIMKNKDKKIKFIIAPHEIKAEDILEMIKSFNGKTIRYSQADEHDNNKDVKVLIIDSIGMLSQLYKYGKIAYIGGGFGKGIHNILEPAAFGMPIFFGPNYRKFNEAVELINSGCAYSIKSSEELNSLIFDLLSNEKKLEDLSLISKKFVEKNKGATERIIAKIKEFNPSK